MWAYPRCRHIGPPRDLCLVSHCAHAAGVLLLSSARLRCRSRDTSYAAILGLAVTGGEITEFTQVACSLQVVRGWGQDPMQTLCTCTVLYSVYTLLYSVM